MTDLTFLTIKATLINAGLPGFAEFAGKKLADAAKGFGTLTEEAPPGR